MALPEIAPAPLPRHGYVPDWIANQDRPSDRVAEDMHMETTMSTSCLIYDGQDLWGSRGSIFPLYSNRRGLR